MVVPSSRHGSSCYRVAHALECSVVAVDELAVESSPYGTTLLCFRYSRSAEEVELTEKVHWVFCCCAQAEENCHAEAF